MCCVGAQLVSQHMHALNLFIPYKAVLPRPKSRFGKTWRQPMQWPSLVLCGLLRISSSCLQMHRVHVGWMCVCLCVCHVWGLNLVSVQLQIHQFPPCSAVFLFVSRKFLLALLIALSSSPSFLHLSLLHCPLKPSAPTSSSRSLQVPHSAAPNIHSLFLPSSLVPPPPMAPG